jgi:2'-5' RNA ligase
MTVTETRARMFFALWPSPGAARKLAGQARVLASHAGGRVTRTDSIHLTLAFLGDVALDRVEALLALPSEVTSPPFELRFERLGVWPRNGIGWAAPSDTPGALVELQARLARWLGDAGFRVEARAFVPHATLIRKATRAAPELAIPPIAWRVDEFVLVRSRLSATGSRYETLGRFALNHEGKGGVRAALSAGDE